MATCCKKTKKFVTFTDNTDRLIGYTREFQETFASKDGHKISMLLRAPDANRHLQGYRLRKGVDVPGSHNDKYGIISTPVLDILKNFPNIAGQIFYNMVSVEMSKEKALIQKQCRLPDLEIGKLNDVTGVVFDYELFDPKRIKIWHQENQEKENLAPLDAGI